jgi:hypothetical protein
MQDAVLYEVVQLITRHTNIVQVVRLKLAEAFRKLKEWPVERGKKATHSIFIENTVQKLMGQLEKP